MWTVNKTMKIGAMVAIVTIAALVVTLSTQEIQAKTLAPHVLDFSAKVQDHIYAKAGETLNVPVEIFGSTTPRNVDVVVTESDWKHGAEFENTTNPKLPEGFAINLPIRHISMSAMNETQHEKPLMTVNITIGIDKTVLPGVYPFAIHMIDVNSHGSEGQHIRYFYIHIQ